MKKLRSFMMTGRAFNRGNAMVEYTVVLLLLVVVLIASPDVITQIIDALKNLYAAFTAALGQTYPTPEGSISHLDFLLSKNP